MAIGDSPIGSEPLGTGASSRSPSSTTDYVENDYVEEGYAADKQEGGPLTLAGDPITIDGSPITIGGNRVTMRKPQRVQEPRTDGEGVSVNAASWTGLSSSAEKAQAIRVVLPAAMNSIETLIAHYEVQGGNGGPPLEERAALLHDLRALHQALGALLDAAVDERWVQYGDGLIIEAVGWLGRVKSAVCNDPLPLAIAALSEVILGVLGLPGAGALAAAAAFGAKQR